MEQIWEIPPGFDPDFIPVPIIELPSVPRQLVLQLFDTGDLFDISLCSKQMAQLVKETRTLAATHSLFLRPCQSQIEVRFLRSRRSLYIDFSSGVSRDQMKEQRQIGDIFFFYIQKMPNHDLPFDQFNISYTDCQRGMLEVSKHLCHIFPGPVDLELAVSYSPKIHEIFQCEHLKKLDSLRIVGGIMMKPLLQQVFEKVEVRRKLVVKPEVDDEYVIRQAFNVEDLHLSNAFSWRIKDLLQLQSRVAFLQSHWFKWQDLEAFAQNWLNNPNSNLKRIRFGWAERPISHEFEHLNIKKWDPKQRERKYLYYENRGLVRIDCEHGMDIEKENGDLATIVYHRNSLYFLVWTDQFPERKRMEQLPEVLASYYRQLEDFNREYKDSSSLERLLSNPSLKLDEFVDTYKVLRGLDSEVRLSSIGRSRRRRVFDKMYQIIDYQDYVNV